MDHTYSIRVIGKVQGVFFRQSVQEKADELGITGKVKNEPDDSVSLVATGPKEQLEKLIEWCREGPPRAKVENVEYEEIPLKNFRNFSIDRW